MSGSGLAVQRAGTPLEVLVSTGAPRRVAIVLGSAFSQLADLVEPQAIIPYDLLPEHPLAVSAPPSRVAAHPAGHAAELVIGQLAGVPVVVFSGRVHLYQGVDARAAAWPARVAAGLGCETLIVTNASGAVSPHVRPGQLALITDHLNLTGTNPLIGWTGAGENGPFVPLRDAYDPDLRALAHTAASSEELDLAEGVYAAVPGPSYETPAEVAALRVMGADFVGMSTVPEVIVARALGMRVLGLSLVTNIAAGVALSHDAVLSAGGDIADELARLVIAILRAM